jgi:tubulin-folding cofactor B
MDILSNDYASQNIKLDCTHSQLKQRLAEIRMDKRWTIGQVKSDIERRFGSNVSDQTLQLQNS